MEYIKRILDKDLDIREQAFGAIQIVGPRGVGKTRTAQQRCKTVIAFEDEDKRDAYLITANINPSSLLKGKKPILIDEWQDAPKMWGAVRMACDKEDCFGSYYLTGSTAKHVDTPHSGTARISTVTMLPMSLYESGESNGKISLSELFADPAMEIDGIRSDLTMDRLIFAACRGGWPRALAAGNDKAKLLIAPDYLQHITREDISRVDGRKRNQEWAELILRSYARNVGILAKKGVIHKDVAATTHISEDALDDYINALKELYVLQDVDSWTPQIRSPKNLRSQKKRLFIDPSVAVAALGLGPSYFRTDYDLFGHVFESLVFRDLAVYSSALGGRLSHYHDALGLEVDAVLHLADGRYAFIEIKLGGKYVQEGIDSIEKVVSLIRDSNESKRDLPIPEPTLKMVITGGDLAYKSKEGVLIVPIGCLKD
jgi:predicted AAA+ superfamily ATPase